MKMLLLDGAVAAAATAAAATAASTAADDDYENAPCQIHSGLALLKIFGSTPFGRRPPNELRATTCYYGTVLW
jgi:hypothetical protein